MATSSSTRRMIGGIEETSASFEARSAPRSYPTQCKSGVLFWSCGKLVVPAHDQEQIAWGHMIELGGEMRGENSHLVLAEPGSD